MKWSVYIRLLELALQTLVYFAKGYKCSSFAALGGTDKSR